MGRESNGPGGGAALGAGALMLLVCCGSHLLALGAIGALATGSVLGVAAGALGAVAVAVVAVALAARRRRRAGSCPVRSEGA